MQRRVQRIRPERYRAVRNLAHPHKDLRRGAGRIQRQQNAERMNPQLVAHLFCIVVHVYTSFCAYSLRILVLPDSVLEMNGLRQRFSEILCDAQHTCP